MDISLTLSGLGGMMVFFIPRVVPVAIHVQALQALSLRSEAV